MAETKMNTMMDSGPRDPLAALLSAWRLWLLGALVGALLGFAAYQLFPPDYRARATVVVDMNAEEAWDYFPDRELFQFIGRETERLVLLAWSDNVMQATADAVPGIAAADLRQGVLQLSQPSDGGWHFYADDSDPATAQALASAWAAAFVDAVHEAVAIAPELEQARDRLSDFAQDGVPLEDSAVGELMEQIRALEEANRGVSIYTDLYISEGTNLPVERTPNQAAYLLAGSLIGALALALYSLLRQA